LVESSPGKGSGFAIYLPREQVVANETAAPERYSGPGPRGLETVLLVEDEVTVRKFTRKILEMQGYRVLEAHNGESALLVNDQYKDLEIHLLVTDMVMPGMGGRELARRFLASRPESRMLFMSGYTEDSAFGPNEEPQGTARFLHKPFTPAGLAHAVREALDISPVEFS
jgi:CheY-like chemotaxis protein